MEVEREVFCWFMEQNNNMDPSLAFQIATTKTYRKLLIVWSLKEETWDTSYYTFINLSKLVGPPYTESGFLPLFALFLVRSHMTRIYLLYEFYDQKSFIF